MPSFDTPESISVNLELGVGRVRVTAGDRTDTVVEIRPTDEADASDVAAAEQTRVDYANGTLEITGPRRILDFSRKTRSVEVSIELPSGSNLAAHLWMGDIRAAGRLGECRLKTTGNIRLDRAGPLHAHTGAGHITADDIGGNAEVSTGSGKIQIGTAEGALDVKNSNGDTAIGSVTGDVRVRNANGAIDIERVGAGADVKTSNGAIRLGEVVRGSVALGTAMGDLDVGIAAGTAAWLEVHTSFGHVRNELDNATGPDKADETVEVRGRTAYGDITIHRS